MVRLAAMVIRRYPEQPSNQLLNRRDRIVLANQMAQLMTNPDCHTIQSIHFLANWMGPVPDYSSFRTLGGAANLNRYLPNWTIHYSILMHANDQELHQIGKQMNYMQLVRAPYLDQLWHKLIIRGSKRLSANQFRRIIRLLPERTMDQHVCAIERVWQTAKCPLMRCYPLIQALDFGASVHWGDLLLNACGKCNRSDYLEMISHLLDANPDDLSLQTMMSILACYFQKSSQSSQFYHLIHQRSVGSDAVLYHHNNVACLCMRNLGSTLPCQVRSTMHLVLSDGREMYLLANICHADLFADTDTYPIDGTIWRMNYCGIDVGDPIPASHLKHQFIFDGIKQMMSYGKSARLPLL